MIKNLNKISMKKYIGDIYWIGGNYKGEVVEGHNHSKVTRAILENNVFKIDHTNPDNPDSLIVLRSKDDFAFDGSMKYIDEKVHAATVNLKMYQNKKNMLLIGDWIELGNIFNCIIELTEVKDF